jgi:hypothetical protein
VLRGILLFSFLASFADAQDGQQEAKRGVAETRQKPSDP